MTIVGTIKNIADWLNEGVCQKFKFKIPPKGERKIDDGYEYELANPVAMPMFIPAKDKLPPTMRSNMPAVAVQILQGEDNGTENKRTIDIQLGICTWNPGIHAKDIFYPKGKEPIETPPFQLSYDGWMDAWNFVDAIVNELESTSLIKGMQVASNRIKYGPYKEQDNIVEAWPLWLAYVQFSVRSDFLRNNTELEKLL